MLAHVERRCGWSVSGKEREPCYKGGIYLVSIAALPRYERASSLTAPS